MCASAHALVHGERGEGRTDREGPRCRERQEGARGAMARRLANQARETEREEGRTRAKQLAPTGRPQRTESERERERACAGEKATADRRGPPVRRHERAGTRPNWAELGCWAAFPFPFSLDFLIPFLFLF
jgi:hypothetical protein